jgi:anti-sigma-K factor RskA
MNRTGDPGGAERHDAELHELAAAYALDALDEFERVRFERELATSPDLQAEVDAFRAATAGLAEEVDPVAPPPSLKANLFDRLDDVPQERRADTGAGIAGGTAERREADVDAPGAGVGARESAGGAPDAGGGDELAARRGRRRLTIVLSAAAAAVVLVVGAVVGVNWFGPNGWGAQREMSQLAEAPDAQQVTQEVDGTEVTLIWSEAEQRSAIVAEGLPDVGGDHTYELWYIHESGPVPAGTFDARGDEAWRILEGEFSPGVVVGITVEPAGGSPEPTTDPVVVFET